MKNSFIAFFSFTSSTTTIKSLPLYRRSAVVVLIVGRLSKNGWPAKEWAKRVEITNYFFVFDSLE